MACAPEYWPISTLDKNNRYDKFDIKKQMFVIYDGPIMLPASITASGTTSKLLHLVFLYGTT
jgi:hypothetical protein